MQKASNNKASHYQNCLILHRKMFWRIDISIWKYLLISISFELAHKIFVTYYQTYNLFDGRCIVFTRLEVPTYFRKHSSWHQWCCYWLILTEISPMKIIRYRLTIENYINFHWNIIYPVFRHTTNTNLILTRIVTKLLYGCLFWLWLTLFRNTWSIVVEPYCWYCIYIENRWKIYIFLFYQSNLSLIKT